MSFDYQQHIRTNYSGLYPNLFTNNSLIPSAPPVEEAEECSIKWKELPKAQEPRWYQVQANRESIKRWSGRLSFPTGAATVYTGLWFTATPLMVLGTFATFGIATLALVTTRVALGYLAPNPLDPEHRLKQRQEAEDDFKNKHNLTYDKVKKYGETIISNDELQELLRYDILSLTYNEFVIKHGQKSLEFLNEANKESLKWKYISHLIERNAGTTGLNEILKSEQTKFFGVKLDDLARDFVAAELYRMYSNQLGYQDFISRNGLEALPYVIHSNYNDWFTEQFLTYVMDKMQNKGGIQVQEGFTKDFEAFGMDVKKMAIDAVVRRSIAEFLSGAIDYATFRFRNEIEHLERYAVISSTLKAELKRKYLTMPYTMMEKFNKDRQFLEITVGEFKEALTNYWNGLKMQDILKNHASDFFDSLQAFFGAKDWTAKVLNDCAGMSLKEILKLSPDLLRYGLLTPQTMLLSGKRLQEQFGEELVQYQTLEALASDYLVADLIKQKVVTANHPKLVSLVVDFMKRHPKEFLNHLQFNSQLETDCRNLMYNCDGIFPNNAVQILATFQQHYSDEIARAKNFRDDLQKQFQNDIKLLDSWKEARIKEHKALTQIDIIEGEYNQHLRLKESFEKSMHTLELEIQNLNREQANLNSKITENQKNISRLNSHREDPAVVQRGIAQLQSMISQLEQRHSVSDSSVQSQLLNDPDLQRLRKEIEVLNGQVEKAKLRKEYDNLVEEAKSFAGQKKVLKEQNEEDEAKLNKEVTGALAAVGALVSKRSIKQRMESNKTKLEAIEKKEKRIEVLAASLKNDVGSPSSNNLETSLARKKRDVETLKTQIKQPLVRLGEDLKEKRNDLQSLNYKLEAIQKIDRQIQQENTAIQNSNRRIDQIVQLRNEKAPTLAVDQARHLELSKIVSAMDARLATVRINFEHQKEQVESEFRSSKARQEAQYRQQEQALTTEHANVMVRIEVDFVQQL